MKNNMWKKGLVLGIICLFIGSSIVSGVYLKYYGKNGENISIEYKLEKNIGNVENFEDIGQWSVFNYYNPIFKRRVGDTSLHDCIKEDVEGMPWPIENIGCSVQETSDKGYIICGYTGSVECFEGFLIKTDNYGYESWNKTFRVKHDTMFYSVEQTADGGYIVTGYTWDCMNDTVDAFLLKTDEQGNCMWEITYNELDLTMGISVRQTNDGGYILSGITGNSLPDDSKGLLIKTDGNGSKTWVKTYEFEYVVVWNEVQQTAEGGYILGGTIGQDDNGLAFLLKTDEYGNEMWNKTFSFMDLTFGLSVKQTKDGGFVILVCSYSYSYSSWPDINTIIIKTDDLGVVEWSKTFEDSIGCSVEQTSDNGFIIGGQTPIQDESFASYALLLKTDEYGNKVWNKIYYGIWEAQGSTVVQTEDNGYVLTGVTSLSFFYNISYILLLKTDNNGNEKWCRNFNVAGITPGYVKFYGWNVNNSIYKVSITIGKWWHSRSSSHPIGYYETILGMCPGSYIYSISWFGKEAGGGVEGYINVSEGEYIEIRQNLTFCDDLPEVDIVKPENALYLNNWRIFPFFIPVIVGNIEITVNASDFSSGIDCVKFYIDGEFQFNDSMEPYCLQWDNKSFGNHTIKVVAFDKVGYFESDEIKVWKFF